MRRMQALFKLLVSILQRNKTLKFCKKKRKKKQWFDIVIFAMIYLSEKSYFLVKYKNIHGQVILIYMILYDIIVSIWFP